VLALSCVACVACGGGGDGDPDPDAGPAPTTALTSDALPVLVAEREIPAGTDAAAALADGSLREDTVRRDQFPEDAIVSAELIEDKVAAQDLVPGTIVTVGMFVDPTSPTT
jgi:flagella basal body P-ring formation protein FlgA